MAVQKASRAASARAGELRDEPVANAASPTLPAAEARPDAGATQPAPGPAPGEAGSASTKKGPPAKDKPKRGDKKAAQAASAAPETRTSAKTEEEAAQLVAKVTEAGFAVSVHCVCWAWLVGSASKPSGCEGSVSLWMRLALLERTKSWAEAFGACTNSPLRAP